MGMVLSTGDELQLEVDRLRKERDLAREEAIQARTERDTATLRVSFSKSNFIPQNFELKSSLQSHRHEKKPQNASL